MKLWWYLARASGLVAWAILTLAVVWGLLLSTRLLQHKRKPAWLLDLHRWLGMLSVVFTGLHLVGLVADNYVEFGLRDILVPMASRWKPGAVAWGVVGLYLLAAIQISSWAMKRMPRRAWKAIHLTSFVLFFVASIHAGLAGTDATGPVYRWTALGMVSMVVFTIGYRIFAGTLRSGKRTSATGPAARSLARETS